ncbi:MAG: sigma 54-interacting transcriptional regulator, partial [Deltaproteobacteria bacterium]|nr:sigma 54-interacting transcriptional regulator [Deltaproteobacteria bacterium]
MSFNKVSTQSLEPDARRTSTVVALRSITTGTEFVLAPDKERWMLGSGPGCELTLDDPCVSATHATLERRDGSIIVRDRRSRNGTFLDNSAIESAELRVGAYLQLGKTTLVAIGAFAKTGRRASELLRGHAPNFRATFDPALRVAQSECNVLVVGETGTGKDLVARLIHEGSRRAANRYVPVNCGAIPRELIGSELFGHERGAFTGAHADREGYFFESSGGTLFLDELGELPLEMQPSLLRAIENRTVRRVGGSCDRLIDVR